MIIHSMRLKNIKSFGEGPEGEGVTITFQPGVNRIAGRNGHGKTTLIESLGYALFQAEPQCLEAFDVATYFLRAGCRTGEIDVTFSHGGETWRVERGLGASKRRSKVVQVDDGSICAEDDREVYPFLSRVLGLAGARRLPELFAKLLGVQQGHLTRPFDAKPSQAKDFFEPLLEVEVFRQCFERLKPAVDQFAAQRQDQDRLLAGVEERVRERQDSPAAVLEGREALALCEGEVLRLQDALDGARRAKEALEARHGALLQATRDRDQAEHAHGLRRQERTQAEGLAAQAEAAAAALAALAPGHDAWLRAEKALGHLRLRQEQQAQAAARRDQAARTRAERAAQAQAALDRAGIYTAQKQNREEALAGLRRAHEALERQLDQDRPAFEAAQAGAEAAKAHQGLLAPFLQGLPAALARQQRLLEQMTALEAELGAWDPAALAAARATEHDTENRHQALADALAQAQERHRTLEAQLRDLGNGACPFLKEQCRQFDPAKVKADVGLLAQELPGATQAVAGARTLRDSARRTREALTAQEEGLAMQRRTLEERAREFAEGAAQLVPAAAAAAGAALQAWIGPGAFPVLTLPRATPAAVHQACAAFADQAAQWREAARAGAKTRLDAAAAEAQARQQATQTALHQAGQLAQWAQEITTLGAQERADREAAQALERQAAQDALALAALEEALLPFATLDAELAAQTLELAAHRAAHEDYLGQKPAADQAGARALQAEACRAQEAGAAAALQTLQDALAELGAAWDPQALQDAASAFQVASAGLAAAAVHRDKAREALAQAELRQAQWQAACTARDGHLQTMARLKAAADLGELARDVLKNAAPAVAQHLCTAIAGRAQGIYNRINHDPAELDWSSQRYSLRLAPGERRFAMLSGGEQTKLALAMTLAMIQEFSGLRFCIFDEPTYGVDAESRARLADAILEAQEAAGLEQLLLVSHDDAFEGKIEHSILLRKSAARGTEMD